MLNYIWAAIILSSFAFSLACGTLSEYQQAIIGSASAAIAFIINLTGIMALWSGLMEIAEKTNLIKRLSFVFLPLTKILFPKQKDSEILSCIIMSFMANVFGAGNSSTVFALRTMEKLNRQNNSSTLASDDMCTFAVVNMAFAPLFPLVTITLRQELNSAYPYSILLPSLLVSASTVIVSILICKILEKR